MRINMTNVYSAGGYSIEVELGSERKLARLILDSGSSTLVVTTAAYDPGSDTDLSATSYAQDVTYGIGGWAGPVVNTDVFIEAHHKRVGLTQAPLAVAVSYIDNCFIEADGFLGLAYHHLDKSYDMSNKLEGEGKPATTWPWPFEVGSSIDEIKQFKQMLWQQPEADVKPYFTALEEEGVVSNRFGFLSGRSSVYHAEAGLTDEQLDQDPINHGVLVLGGGEEQTDLYQGEFTDVAVLHDVYYNTNLVSVQVAGQPERMAPPLDEAHVHNYFTNSIIDTGASYIVLVSQLFSEVMDDLYASNPDFESVLKPFLDFMGKEIGIPASRVKPELWPDILFTFSSHNNETVTVSWSPMHYWQINSPSCGQASFKLLSQLPGWPNQSLMGLPLLNGYYAIFDRDVDHTGVIRFANARS